MRILLAIFMPWLLFLTIGRPFTAIFCFLLQVTVIGWIPAALWAVYGLSQYKTNQKISQLRRETQQHAQSQAVNMPASNDPQ